MPESGRASGEPKHVLLLIDEDPKMGRLVRLSLHSPTCQVLSSARHQEGLLLAARHKPELILMETHFTGADGLLLAEKLRRAPETQRCAVAFLTADDSVARHIRAVQLGAMDYITKPIEGRALGARLTSLWDKLAHGPPLAVAGPAVDRLSTLLEQLEVQGGSGTVELHRGGQDARIVVSFGGLEAAECGPLRREEALTEIGAHGDWELIFHRGAVSTPGSDGKASPSAEVAKSAARPAAVRTGIENTTSPWTEAVTHLEIPGSEAHEPTLADAAEDASPQGGEGWPTVRGDPAPPATLPSALAAPFLGDLSDGFEEDVPTAMNFKVLAESTDTGRASRGRSDQDPTLRATKAVGDAGYPSPPKIDRHAGAPGRAAGPSSDHGFPGREWFRSRLAASGPSSVLLVVPAPQVRGRLQHAVEDLGATVFCVSTGLEAYTAAREQRPLAILSDARAPRLDGRELLAAIRSDFQVRETPFIIVASDYLAEQRGANEDTALAEIVRGLATALAPRLRLYQGLREEGKLSGWVEPIGVAHLLRAMGSADASGCLELKTKEPRSAVVFFRRGQICGATVNTAQSSSVGPMAMLHLLGLEWQEYDFAPDAIGGGQVPLGDLDYLIETACRQNNTLLSHVLQHGVRSGEVSVDTAALDVYLQRLPLPSRDLVVRLMLGEKAMSLVEKGLGTPGHLKSILHDLRRKAIIYPLSLRAPADAMDPGAVAGPTVTAERPAAGQRPRWFVVLAAGLITVVVAAAAYATYRYLREAKDKPPPARAERALSTGSQK
jgi:DNA-binding response OmpR family regulator